MSIGVSQEPVDTDHHWQKGDIMGKEQAKDSSTESQMDTGMRLSARGIRLLTVLYEH